MIKQDFILNVTSNGCLFSISNEIIFFGIFNNSLLTLSQSNNILHINKKCKRDEINNTFLWHCRLGHISENRIYKLYKENFFDPYDYESLGTCESCLMGKMTKTPFSGNGERTNELLRLVHIDVCGPMTTHAKEGYSYNIHRCLIKVRIYVSYET